MRHAPTTHYHLLADLGNEPDSTARQDAWKEFVRLYEPALSGFLRRLGLQHADAMEIAQEVFIQVQRSAKSSSLPTQDFRPWLAQVAKNKAIDLIRKNVRYSKYLTHYAVEGAEFAGTNDGAKSFRDHQTNGFESVWQLEVRQQLFMQAASQVRDEVLKKHWAAFWMTAVELQSPALVARKLGLSVGNVYVTKCRIMDRIRNLVKSLSFEAVDLNHNSSRDLESKDGRSSW